jgi:putative peptide zinc metalloprotease protein
MPYRDDYRRSAVDRELAVRARGDLQVVPVAFAGQSTFVVKDPVTGEAFHLSAEEHALLVALRQPASLKSLQRLLERQFAPCRATILELQQFVTRLYDQGLLVGDNPGQGSELLARGVQQRRRNRWSSLLAVLAVRIASFSAVRPIDGLYRACGWLCSRWAVLLAGVLVGAAALAAAARAPELAARMPQLRELMQPRYWPAWIAAIAGVKVLHELGHALTCRHFGARPQEMGVMLLVGAPTLYCDVSDAWRLPSKWQRMGVSSAGMGVELVIAAAALLGFLYAQPGLFSAICLSLVIVCSAGTLLVNLNPLLRYDGYYLLADWLEVPNLAERARGLPTAAWRQWLLGDRPQADALLGPRKRRALWAYAILSKAYLALVLAGACVLFLKLARPYHLENAVYTLAAVAVVGMAVRPAAAAARMVRNPATRARFRWLRLFAALVVLAAATAGVLLLPITRRVTAPVVLSPAKSHPLFAVAAGELQYAVAPGTLVEADEPIARLANPELELEVEKLRGKVREAELKLSQLETLRTTLPDAAALIPTTEAELADARAQLAEQEASAAKLVVRAPVAGRVLSPPDRQPPRAAPGALGQWSGSPLEAKNLGAWIEPGTPLAIIAEPAGWTAWAGVAQADVSAVEIGQPVRLSIDAQETKYLAGRVTHVARRARENRAEPSAAVGPLGDSRYHVVDVAIDEPDAALLPTGRGTAKIEAYRTTIGELLVTEFQQLFRGVVGRW